MTLSYYRPDKYSRLSGMFANHTIECNIIEGGQVVPNMPCSVFSMSDGGHFGFWALQVSKMFNLSFLFSSYQSKANQSLSHCGHPIPTESTSQSTLLASSLVIIS